MILAQVERILAEIHRGGTPIVLVAQSMETAVTLAHRVCVRSQGQMVFIGTVAELKSNELVRREYLEVRAGSAPAAAHQI